MLNDNEQLQNDQGDAPIVTGTPVYDAAGAKLGEVVEHDSQSGQLVLQKGWLFPKDVYVPTSAIQRKTTDGIYLNMTKDQLQSQNWENPSDQTSGWQGSDTGTMGGLRDDTLARDARNVGDVGDVGDTPVGDRTTTAREGDIAVPVREEELQATKSRQEAGRVHLNRDVVEEQQNLNVPVTHEEIQVERVPRQGDATDLGDDAFTERDVDVPLMGEQVQTEKQARVNEELRLRKQPVTETQQVSGTVRKERVNVEGVDDQENLPLDNRGADYSTDYADDDTAQRNRL